MKRSTVVLFLIVFLAAGLRLYRITDIPPGVNRDEASIGFTAYSLLKTGRDEYGKWFPLSFQSLGDWKLPMYIYETAPFVAVFGMSELAVRLPSAIAGIATVFLTYFLILELTAHTKTKRESLALLGAFILSIAPWHIHMSRVESESNTAVFFVTLGLLAFLKSLRGKTNYLIPAAVLFALTYFTYAGNHIFTTLFVSGIVYLYHKEVRAVPTWKSAAVVFGILFTIIVSQTLLGADRTKISGISIFGDPNVVYSQIEVPRDQHANSNDIFSKLIHNRVTFAATSVWKNYINAYSAPFLFISGAGNHAHNIQGFGNMYPIEAVFLFLGVVTLVCFRAYPAAKLMLVWLIIAPVAASITKDAPHTNRMFAVFPALTIVVALGIYALYENFKKEKFRYIFIAFVSLIYLGSFLIYVDRYYVHFPRYEAQYWGYGYKQLASVIEQPENANKKIIMSHPEYSPYIYLLFYTRYDPAAYQKEAVRYPPTSDAFIDVKNYNRFEFRAIDWQTDVALHNTLLVDLPQDIPGALKQTPNFRSILLPNGSPFLGIVTLK